MKHRDGFARIGTQLTAAVLLAATLPVSLAADASAGASPLQLAAAPARSPGVPSPGVPSPGVPSPDVGADSSPRSPGAGAESGEPPGAFLPLECTADQTGGFHDYPDDDGSYEPALFNSTPFRLDENVVFMTNLPQQPGVDLYVTLTAGEDPVTTELECRQVRGVDGSPGYSCVNIPPSEMLLINRKTLRFTRTAVGGWTFAGADATHSGDSIFVEYGTCAAAAP